MEIPVEPWKKYTWKVLQLKVYCKELQRDGVNVDTLP